MAEQIVSSVLTKPGELLINEYFSLKGVNQQLELVRLQLGLMRSFLRDAEEKKSKGDNRTRQWVGNVRDVAFEIDNAIDTYVVEIHNVRRKHVPLWKRCFFTPAEWRALDKLGKKISTIQAKITTISDSANHIKIQNLGEDKDEEMPLLRKPMVPGIDNEEIVGFEVDREKIINVLVHDESTQGRRRRVVFIVGLGGLGKTTLTKKVFNNKEVKEYFNPCVWLTISQEFKQTDVLKKFYEEATGDKRNESEEPEAYLRKLHNHLCEKKYLVVLDDVWSGDVLKWLNDGLPDIENGSRIIITTRSLHVAWRADYSSVFELPLLTQKESLDLLLKNVIQNSDPLVNYPVELTTNLANRCDGLPLAIVVLGRLMSRNPPAQWYKLEKELDWHRDGPDCMKTLASSYHYLPYHLKACFRYLACFPEDYEIDAERLLRMWIAEGFMMCHGEGTLEDEAERCLEELAERFLVQVIERQWNGSIRSLRVHVLLRDLAMHEAKENDYLLTFPNQNTLTNFNKAHRIVIHDHIKVLPESENNMPNVSSFLNFDGQIQIGIIYPLLRVLELRGSKYLTRLPKEFNSMIYLRYLGLANTNLEHLPKNIDGLETLQTVNVQSTKLNRIPNSLWKIKSLRHVSVTDLPGPPPSTNMVNLQTLEQFCVPKSWKDSLPYFPSLRNLKLIYYDEEDSENSVTQDWDIVITLLSSLNKLVSLDIEGDNIPVKIVDVQTSPSYQHLQTLLLSGYYCRGYSFATKFSLDTIEMPQNLLTLRLSNIWFDKDPMPTLEKLPCLKSLKLWGIKNVEEMVCSEFPQLEELSIFQWYGLKQWKVAESAMPLLKKLYILRCLHLPALPELNHVKTLQKLVLDGLSNVLKNELDDRTGEEWKKIQHIPTITIKR